MLAAGAGVAAAAPILSACGGRATTTGQPVVGAGSGTPKRGGTVRFAFSGAGAAESLDPFGGGSPADYARTWVVYDELFALIGGVATPRLAESVETAPDGRSFVLNLRQGVTWHDGSPFRAADVQYTLNYLSSPDRPYPSELSAFLDIPAVRIRDDRTLEVPTLMPVGDPATLFAGAGMRVIKDGTKTFDVASAVGTGSYRFADFAPGQQARLTRYDQHWDGAPYADELVVLSIDDPSARVNAVRAGQADWASDIPYTVARTGPGGDGLEIRSAGEGNRTGLGFVLNTTVAPFGDARARRAVRLAVDRQAMVDRVLLGYGSIGNDLFGNGAQYFAKDVAPLARDVDTARRLLAEAGATGAPVVVRSADYEAGLNSSTDLFVEQLRELGLDARSQLVSVPEYFAPDAIATVQAIAFPLGPFPLTVIYSRSAAYPSLALPDPELQQAVATAFATPDEATRAKAWADAQAVMTDRGNSVVWGLADTLSLSRTNVAGIQVRDSAKYPYLGKAGLA
ncbi:MAG: ABC transporter substrate-binding protein [Pseudonocardia sp. SCN 72-86]|nr:MAG: ABC transporter substrate-binding protein [Pseudonocardia sp. SCN 72-86]